MGSNKKRAKGAAPPTPPPPAAPRRPLGYLVGGVAAVVAAVALIVWGRATPPESEGAAPVQASQPADRPASLPETSSTPAPSPAPARTQTAASAAAPSPAAASPPLPAPLPATGPLPPLPFVPYAPPRPIDVVRSVYEFAARHPEVLRYVPCYCGCENSGHRANDDCFVASRAADGSILSWDDHGFG